MLVMMVPDGGDDGSNDNGIGCIDNTVSDDSYVKGKDGDDLEWFLSVITTCLTLLNYFRPTNFHKRFHWMTRTYQNNWIVRH
jgi:hypothetical protein